MYSCFLKNYLCSLNEDKLKSLKDLCGDDNFYYDLIQKHTKAYKKTP
jgi:hypothetical protein